VRRLLITGGAGFIGANFVQYWLRQHPDDRIVVLDALTYAGRQESLEPVWGQIRFEQGDIRDTERVVHLLRQEAIDTLVHFAAESHVDRSISGPAAFVETNVLGTLSLLQAAQAVWLSNGQPHRFHHVSTDEVYGSLGPDDPPFTEATPYAPNSPYSASKAGSDHLVRAWHHTYGLQVTVSNCSNNYGPYQFPEKLIPRLLVSALHGAALPVYGDGQNVRDWLHVEDHCRGIERVLDAGRVGEHYNIGGDNEWRNLDLVHALCEQIDAAFASDPGLATRFPACPAAGGGRCRELIRFVTDRPGHDRRYAIDPGRFSQELGPLAPRAFAQGLAETVRWYLRHESWWRPLWQSP